MPYIFIPYTFAHTFLHQIFEAICYQIVNTMVHLHQVFPSIEAARKAIKQHVLDDSESYKTKKSDKHRFIIICKDNDCNFRIRAAESEKQVVSITVFKLHSCSPTIHYKSRQSQLIKYLVAHHRAAVIDNRNITAKQIQSNERLQYNNAISYQQAYRTIKAIIEEIDGDEAECFSKIPAYLERYVEADEENFA